MIATERVAKAPPDSHTLGIGNLGTHVINAGLYNNRPHDPLRDFVPVSQLFSKGSALVGNIKLVLKTLKELVSYAKANPGKLNIGIAGAAGAVATEIFKSATGMAWSCPPKRPIASCARCIATSCGHWTRRKSATWWRIAAAI